MGVAIKSDVGRIYFLLKINSTRMRINFNFTTVLKTNVVQLLVEIKSLLSSTTHWYNSYRDLAEEKKSERLINSEPRKRLTKDVKFNSN